MSDYIDELAAAAQEGIDDDTWNSAAEICRYLSHKPASAEDLARELQCNPALQEVLASHTSFTPSKWLLNNELGEIGRRRAAAGMDEIENGRDAYQCAARSGLMGLSFSGGGIRSATFNLGILQALAELKLLHCFDYLSSVSGGGYVHQWFAAWAKREGFDKVAEELIPLPDPNCPATHPEPLRWLRRYSNYLTPQLGIFSGDTWVMIATWIRNTILNQIILGSALLALLLIPHLFLKTGIGEGPRAAIAVGLLFGLFVAATWFTGGNLNRCDQHPVSESGVFGRGAVQAGIVAPLLFAAIIASMLLPLLSGTLFGIHLLISFVVSSFLLTLLTLTVTFAGNAPLCYLQSQRGTEHFRTLWDFWRQTPKCFAHVRALFALAGFCLAALISSTAGAAWIAGSEYLLTRLWHLAPPQWVRLILVAGPPLIVSGVLFALVILTGLLGRSYFDSRREWLARLGSAVGFASLAWMVLVGITLLSHPAFIWARPWFKTMIGAVVGWVGTTLGGVLAAQGRQSAGASADDAPSQSIVREALAVVAPYVFIVGLLILISLLAEVLAGRQGDLGVLVLIVASAAVSLLVAWRVDVNEFSMHAFYRDRLARCYLGASNRSRDPNPFTGFDESDTKLAVSALRASKGYLGPYPIFCATLNLTFGEDLAWQERKAASFAFTPLYSGYDVPWTAVRSSRSTLRFNGFVQTEDYAYARPGIHVSTAAAISGAAVSPNQGYHSNPATAFLLTVFNVRLGWWLANPRALTPDGKLIKCLVTRRPGSRRRCYTPPSPRLSILYLINELLGQTDDTSRYIYLSDGGHFDNMGLYELVRRRCRYIVICDAEEDSKLKFEGIGMAIRKCRIDFGAEITLDLRPLEYAADTTNSNAHCVTGSIRYPEDAPAAEPGTVVYIKSSLTGDEPADVLNYKKQDSVFPQDSTTDQWFSESQFESYRRLGHHVALSTFAPADPVAFPCTDRAGRAGYFSNLTKIWSAITPEMREFSPKHTELYGALLEQTRTDAKLNGLFDLLFDRSSDHPIRWKKNNTPEEDADYAARFSLKFIEFIFTVYLQLRLMYPENREHPFAQGWLEIFRNWGRIDVIQDAWTRYGSGYTRGFQLFVESEAVNFHANGS